MNKMMLAGRVSFKVFGKDKAQNYVPPTGENGKGARIAFNISVRKANPDRENNKIYEFIQCTAFGKNAEIINQYVNDGDNLVIEGSYASYRGQNDTYDRVSCLVDRVTLVGNANGGNSASTHSGNQPVGTGVGASRPSTPVNISDDELPF